MSVPLVGLLLKAATTGGEGLSFELKQMTVCGLQWEFFGA